MWSKYLVAAAVEREEVVGDLGGKVGERGI